MVGVSRSSGAMDSIAYEIEGYARCDCHQSRGSRNIAACHGIDQTPEHSVADAEGRAGWLLFITGQLAAEHRSSDAWTRCPMR